MNLGFYIIMAAQFFSSLADNALLVAAFADRMPKGIVMFFANAVKIIGCTLMLFQVNPLIAYALVGLGAAAYSPAKYGILTEYLPHSKLVIANGWIEGLTVTSIILGTMLGGVLINEQVSHSLLRLDIPGLDTGIDTPPEAAIIIIVLVYA